MFSPAGRQRYHQHAPRRGCLFCLLDSWRRICGGARHRLESRLDTSRLEIISGPLHLLACMPCGADAERSARWSALMRQRLLDQQIMVSRPLHHGRHHIKVVLGNPHTSDALIDRLGALLNDTSEEGL